MQFPPENFNNLRQILILLRQGEINLNVGKKSLAALVIMIENPDKVATSNIVELAVIVKISPASITRLTKLLGFKGYNYFRQIFKQSSNNQTDYYSQNALNIVKGNVSTPKSLIDKQLQSTIDNVQQCIKNINDLDLAKIIKLLSIKRKVFVFGHQQSSAIASILSYGLSLIRKEVHLLGPIEHGVATAIGQLKRGDLLVIFSSSPYSQLSVNVASLAAKQGCSVIALTDSLLSPLQDYASASINITTKGHYFTNSLSANCIVVESLLSMVAIELGQKAVDKLKQHELFLTQLNVNA